MISKAYMILTKFKRHLPLVVILLFFIVTRIVNLTSIPVFGDEAIYIRWSQLIKNVDTLRFVPLSDGKQPLFMWITAVLLKYISDPLVAGRLVSVTSGIATLAGLYLICQIFFNSRLALISVLIYTLLPFAFFFDRLALPDNLLSSFGIFSILFSLLLARTPRLDLAIINGCILGLAWLTKSPAIYFIVLSQITFFLYQPKNLKKFYFPLISAAIAFVIYNILRLGPQFHQIALRNLDYVWPLSEIIKHPFDPLYPHLIDIFKIFISYISLPLLITSITGYFINRSKTPKTLLIIGLWWFLPLIATASFTKVFTARYILFTLPPLILLLSFGLSKFNLKFYTWPSLFIIFLPNLVLIGRLSQNPFILRLPATESGYLNQWTSGWGISDAAKYLVDRSLSSNVIVGTEGYFGTLPDGLQIYTDGVPQLTVIGIGIDPETVPSNLVTARNSGDEVYLLINRSRQKLSISELSKLSLVRSYAKPDGDQLQLFRLN